VKHLALCLLLVGATATAQVSTCGPGKNCRARSFTATTGSTSSPAVTIPNLDLFVMGLCYSQTNGSNWNFSAACNVLLAGGTQALLSGSLYFVNKATPTLLTAPQSGSAMLAADTTSSRLWLADNVLWAEVGTAPDPVLDYRQWATEVTATGLAWATGTPRIRTVQRTLSNTANCVGAAGAVHNSMVRGASNAAVEGETCTTTAVANNVQGSWTADGVMLSGRRHKWCGRVTIPDPTNVRVVAGNLPSAVFAAPTDTPVTTGAWFRFSTAAGDTTWQLCVADAAAATCTSTGVTQASSNLLCLEQETGTLAVTAYVQGQYRIRVTTNVPQNELTVSAWGYAGQTLTAAAKAFQFGNFGLGVPP